MKDEFHQTIDEKEAKRALNSLQPHLVKILLDNRSYFNNFIRHRIEDANTAEDLLQETFLKALERGNSIRDDEKIIAWFYRLLRNSIIDYYRGRSAEGRKQSQVTQQILSSFDDTTVIPKEIENGICQCINNLLPTLRENYAELIRRIDLDDEPPTQVAQKLNITTQNLSVRLHRARQALLSSLKKSCGSCAAHGCLECTCRKK